jgi:hypothetical protein
VAAAVEDGVELVRAAAVGKGRELLRVLPDGGLGAVELEGRGVVLGEVDRGGVQRGDPAVGGRYGDGVVGRLEDGIRMGEFGLGGVSIESCGERGKLARNQPVGWSVSPSLECEVRTMRTLGAMVRD